MLLQERARTLYDQLNGELNRFLPGAQFYSVREIIRNYGVSRRVVDDALNRMVNEKILVRQPRHGFFVYRNSPLRKVTFFHCDWVNRELEQIARYLQETFAEISDGYEFNAVPYNYQSSLLPVMEESPADLLILCWPSRPITRLELKAACDSPKPIVFMGRNLVDGSMHSTTRRHEYGVALLVDYLIRKGHSRFGLLVAEARVGGNLLESNMFRDLAFARGCRLTEIACCAEAGNYSPEVAHEALSHHLERFGCDFSALFVISDYAAQGAFRALAEHGLKIPDDVSVVGSGSALSADYMLPPLTTLGVDLRECSRELALAIHEYWPKRNTDAKIAVFSTPKITERGSVGELLQKNSPPNIRRIHR